MALSQGKLSTELLVNRRVEIGRIGRGQAGEIAKVLGAKWEHAEPSSRLKRAGRYQVWMCDATSVQFVRAKNEDPLFMALATELPLTLAHQGIWTVEHYDDHFTLTSAEAFTVGPFRWQEDIQSRLDVFGLELRQKGGQLHGYAHFADLEAGCIADAIDRLYWLEDTFWRINQGIAKYTTDLWKRALEGVGCSEELAEGDDVVNPLAFFPDLPPRQLRCDH